MSPKKLIALSAVVVVLFGFILLFERKMPTTEERSRKGDLYWDIPQDRVQRIEVVRGAETLEFQRTGEVGWRMLRPEKYPADTFAVGSLVTELAEMKRAAGEEPSDVRASEYGFDKPSAKATIVWNESADAKNAKTRVVEFGAAVPGTDVVAARVEGSPKVLFVPSSVLESLKKSADEFESREVFGSAASDAARLEILRGRGKLAFVKKDGVWWLAEPMSDYADSAEIDRFTGALAGLRVREFLHGPQDLAALGLDPPLFHVALTGAKNAVTAVDFGATRSDGNTLYARRDGQVLTVDHDIVDELSKEAEAFRSREQRTRIALDLGRALASCGEFRLSVELFHETLTAGVPIDDTEAVALEAEMLAMAFHEFTCAPIVGPFWERRFAELDRGDTMAPTILAPLTVAIAASRGPADDAIAIAEQVLASGELGAPNSVLVGAIGNGLIYAGALSRASQVYGDSIAAATGRGNRLAVAWQSTMASKARLRLGDIRGAEADARLALDLFEVGSGDPGIAWCVAHLLDALVARGAVDDAEELVGRFGSPAGAEPTLPLALLRTSLAHFHLAPRHTDRSAARGHRGR